jgi:hypothetical protein
VASSYFGELGIVITSDIHINVFNAAQGVSIDAVVASLANASTIISSPVYIVETSPGAEGGSKNPFLG